MIKILIVDDNEAIRTILRFTFSSHEYLTYEAENGLLALEIAEKESPDFVLLDIMMPGMDGYSVCSKMKAMPNMAQSKIIALSALTQKQDIDKGIQAGADRYLSKPFTPSQLVKLIQELKSR